MKIFHSLKTRWVAWVWNHTPNCAEMSRLASRSLEQPLSMRTWLKMGPHFDELSDHLPARTLSTEARRRIMQRLQRLQGMENKSS